MESPERSSLRRTGVFVSVSAATLSLAVACLGWGVPYDGGSMGCGAGAGCAPGEVCFAGVCQAVCKHDSDCQEPGTHCLEGVCQPGSVTTCKTALDCTSPGQCQVADGAGCVAGRCEYRTGPAGVECIDNDLCTSGDACNSSGECVGVPVRCASPPANSCNSSNDEYTSYPGLGRCSRDTGDCEYAPTVTPCPNCAAACRDPCAAFTCPDAEGGCQILGVCIGGAPPTCDHSDADTGTPCDLAGSPDGTLDGHCFDGVCSSCSTAAHCTEPPDGDLNCWDAECIDGSCRYTQVAAGTACADTTYTDWGTCGGFVDACDELGMEEHTATDWTCQAGVCAATDRIESQACTRDTDGATCADPSYGSWSSCSGFGDDCDETGTRSRWMTTYTCTDGNCVSSAETDTGSCMRDTDGTSCGGVTYGSWSGCSGFSDACDTTGTQSRTVTTPTCTNGGCSNVVTTGTQSCTRATPPDGTVCGASSWQVCCSGACRDLRSDNSHCGGCGVNCSSQGMTCRSTESGGFTCGTCTADSTCSKVYDATATCWTNALGGNDLCQCHCGPAGSGYAVCDDGGCGANMKCYDCVGDNYCSPGGSGSCP